MPASLPAPAPRRRASRSRRRTTLVIGLGLSSIAAAVAAGVVLANRADNAPPTLGHYLAAANAICEEYGKRLDTIPAPTDPSSPGAVYESIGLALPILRAQAAEVRELVPPPNLQRRVDRFFRLSEASLEHLARARRQAGRRELFPMVQSLAAYDRSRAAAQRVRRSIGFGC